MSLSSPEDGPHVGSVEDFGVDQKVAEGEVSPTHFTKERPCVGSSPESGAEEEGEDDETEEAEDDENYYGDAKRDKRGKEVLAEEDGADYVMSCNLRGPSRHNVKKAERLILGLMSTPKLVRSPEESDEQYTRRVRKHNFLSLAQEFVARNRIQGGTCADQQQMVLPILAGARFPAEDCCCEDSREWAKNMKNSAKCPESARASKQRPFNFESLSLNETASSPLFLPVNSLLGCSSTNQNAIHRYHQRSLAQYDSSCLLKEQCDQQVRPRQLSVTSPTHAGPHCKNSKATIGREPANKASMSYADLPANVAKMARDGHQESDGSKLGSGKQHWRNLHAPSAGPPSNLGTWRGAADRQLSRSDIDLPTFRTAKLSSPPHEILGGFDVYNIETAMPTIDWIAMEEQLAKAAKEEILFHKHHRNNREEIRRKLAMGSDTDDYYGGERLSRKPSLQARLQVKSGMNLQICFMNETASDPESTHPADQDLSKSRSRLEVSAPLTEKNIECSSSSFTGSLSTPEILTSSSSSSQVHLGESKDFLSKQARLQAEARLALAQAKQMAHMQMEVEKQRKKKSPIAEMVGIPFPDGRHKVSRHALVEMNVAQLQVIVNDLHTQIENLNEELVRLLLERDDLHMEQDSMLVDIEDLTRYL